MKLKKIMTEKNLNQRKLSAMADMAQADLNQAILGKKPMFPSWRKRIAAALGMTEIEVFPEYYKKVMSDDEAKKCFPEYFEPQLNENEA